MKLIDILEQVIDFTKAKEQKDQKEKQESRKKQEQKFSDKRNKNAAVRDNKKTKTKINKHFDDSNQKNNKFLIPTTDTEPQISVQDLTNAKCKAVLKKAIWNLSPEQQRIVNAPGITDDPEVYDQGIIFMFTVYGPDNTDLPEYESLKIGHKRMKVLGPAIAAVLGNQAKKIVCYNRSPEWCEIYVTLKK